MPAAAAVAFVAGMLLGPLLDRMAKASLREPTDTPWTSRPWVTGVMAGASGSAAILLVPSPVLVPAWLGLAWVGTIIVRTDATRHRIPDVLSVAALTVGALLLLVPQTWDAYGRGWLAALALTAAFLGLALIGPSGLGMGDVKLAPALGLYLGYLGWTQVIVGVLAGFVLAALAALIVILRDAVTRRPLAGALRKALPFGPFLLVGTLVALLV
jgi:leader peptidase (prepilin peptidase) / N-methyltransferase